MRLIDADELEAMVKRLIELTPTVDPVKHGRWIGEADGYADGELVYDMWHCSSCDYFIEDDEEPTFHYCPNCGARMDEEADHDDHL